MFGARFDDGEAGYSFALSDPLREIVARDLVSVEDALRQASEASASGHWVAGYVAYEAAQAFDSALVVKDGYTKPLVWFGVFGKRIEVEPIVVDPAATGGLSISRWVPAWDRSMYDTAFD